MKKEHKLIYVIAGKDNSLVNAQCQQIVEGLLKQEQRATGLFSIEPSETSITEVLDELRTTPFLSDKRVVLVKNADRFISDNRQLLEKYFDNPCSTGILILAVNSWSAQTKLAKKLPKVGELVSVKQPQPWRLPARLIEYARDAHNKQLTKQAAELLVELSGDELVRLYTEIDKLATFTDDQKTITVEHIEKLIGHNRLFNAFAVIDSCLTGNASHAVERLRKMFAEDRTAEYTVVGAFAFHLRRMFKAKALLEDNLSLSEIIGKLRIWSNKDELFAQLRKVTLKQIGENLQRLAEIDFEIKTGRTNAKVAMEQLVLKLAC